MRRRSWRKPKSSSHKPLRTTGIRDPRGCRELSSDPKIIVFDPFFGQKHYFCSGLNRGAQPDPIRTADFYSLKLFIYKMKNIPTKRISCFRRWSRKGWSAFASLRRQVTIGVLSVSMSILLLATQGVSAHTTDTTAVLRTLRIDEVGISGSQSSPTRNALAQTPLFDRKAQAAAPVQTLEAALRLTPSVDIRERGGKGAQADIAIRGGSFDQTMVLLNGIDFTDVRTGHQSHSLPVDLDCISAVELIDGLPGVGAYAGAVNIRTAPLRSDYLRLDASGGSYGYGYANLSGAVSSERFSVLGAASYRRSDGYRHNTDFSNVNAFMRATCETERAGFFDIQAGYQTRDFGSNGFYAAYNPDQWERTSTALGSVRWLKEFGRLSVGASASYRKNFDRYDWTRGKPMNRHNGDNVGARLWGDWSWCGGTTSLGGDYAFNHLYSTNLGEPLSVPHGDYTHAKARHTGNVWLRHAKEWERSDVAGSAGVSLTPYGQSALWSLSGGWRPAQGMHIAAGASQSMRLPTFTDLYYSSPAQVNNLYLTPEHAVTYRIGIDYKKRCWSFSGLAYYRTGRDIIDWVWHEDNKWYSEQTSRLNTFGAELTGAYAVREGFLRRIALTYGYVTTDRNADIIAKSAMDFMRHKAALSVEVRFLRRLSLALTGSVYDRNGSYTHYPVAGDSSVNEERDYAPYFLLDGRLAWEKGICRLYVDATNITDTRYCDMGGIPLPGAWFTGGITLTIGR